MLSRLMVAFSGGVIRLIVPQSLMRWGESGRILLVWLMPFIPPSVRPGGSFWLPVVFQELTVVFTRTRLILVVRRPLKLFGRTPLVFLSLVSLLSGFPLTVVSTGCRWASSVFLLLVRFRGRSLVYSRARLRRVFRVIRAPRPDCWGKILFPQDSVLSSGG